MSSKGGIFDGLPISTDKSFLRERLAKIDESWAAARFDSLPHVVHILTSKERDGEIQFLKEQCDVIEDVVDEVVHAYHGGFNKAIQNYSQILRFFSESSQSISSLKTQLAETKNFVGSRNTQLRQLWYRSLTLRHIISLLDQIETVAKVPARIENLISEKQFYAAVQLHAQSTLMLEREGLQAVGAMQDVRSELSKLRGVLFYKILDDLHSHLYNKGQYSAGNFSSVDFDSLFTNGTVTMTVKNLNSLSRRTRSMKGDGQLGNVALSDGYYDKTALLDGSSTLDGHYADGPLDTANGVASEGDHDKETTATSHQLPLWLSCATPDEFVESMKKSDASLNVKYLQTLVECLCMLGKVAAAGAIICQRLRPSVHEIISSTIKAFTSARGPSFNSQNAKSEATIYSSRGLAERRLTGKTGASFIGTQMALSPVSTAMTPIGVAQSAAGDLLTSVLDTVVQIIENHATVGKLLESELAQKSDNHSLRTTSGAGNWNTDAEASQITGGFSLSFSLSVIQSECQQLICEILRATPETASADAAAQTARLASSIPGRDRRDMSNDGLSFAFRFTDATVPVLNQGVGQSWRSRPNVLQEGYGTAAALPEQGLYLAASIYRPILQFTDKISLILPEKYSQQGNDGLLTFVEKFLKDHFLPAIFVDYRKCVQQAISSPAAFRPRAHTSADYDSSIEKGRPVLQGLLAIDFLAKEVMAWAQAIPKYSGELIEYVHTFLERAYERCRTSYMEAVLEKQSYMLIGRHDFERAMRLDPASACLPGSNLQASSNNFSDGDIIEAEETIRSVILGLRPIKQENLIHEDHKLILLASLSDSLEYLVDSINRLLACTPQPVNKSSSAKGLSSISGEYRKLAVDCLKILRVEMQLETMFHLQEMINKDHMEDQDTEEPDDYIISLTTQIMRRDEQMAPFISDAKRAYIFGGISMVAASALIKVLTEMKSINLLGAHQVCRNSIAVEQALAAIPAVDCEAVRQRMDRVRNYYELLNLPFDALLAFISENEFLFTSSEYSTLLKVNVPGRDIPDDANEQLADILRR
ncbi:subunit of exocyst complex 8 [Wolffia australiana]